MRTKYIKKEVSIKFQIMMICVLCFVIMQGIIMLNYYNFKKMKIEANNNYFSDLITQLTESVELNCTYLNGMVENVAYSKIVQEYLENNDFDQRIYYYEEIRDFIIPLANINRGIKDIAIIDNQDNVINFNGDNSRVLAIAKEIPENVLWHYTGLHDFYINRVKYPLFSIGANVYSTTDFTRKERIGTVLISFKMDSIFGFGQNEKSEKLPDMIIYDKNKQLVYSSIKDLDMTEYSNYFDQEGNEKAGSLKFEKERYYIKTGDIATNGVKIVYLIPNEELLRGFNTTRIFALVISIAVFGIMLLLAKMVTNNIVVPLRQFMRHLNKVGDGDLRMIQNQVKLSGASELIILSNEFNKMMAEINDLNHRLVKTSTRLYESELAKKQSELEYLYSQINPHFIFNTLETIKGSAVEENAKQTFEMINSLGKIFRYCVRGGNVVTVEEELKVINSYMLLQKIRYSSRLTFFCNVDQQYFLCEIPKMILQPLVENAVVHGLEEKGELTVWIETTMKDNKLYFYVRDDGDGIDEKKRKELIDNLNKKIQTNSIGINNVNSRLKNIYGEEYGVCIEDTRQEGFCVSLCLPVIHSQEKKD